MKLKVINGMSEIAGQGYYTVKGLRDNNVEADMAVWRHNPFGYAADFDLKIGTNKFAYPFYFLKMLKFANQAQKRYNVMHSHYGYTLLPFNLDIGKDKKEGIKIFAEFHGSEIRGMFNEIDYKYFYVETSKKDKAKRQKRIIRLINGCDGIILHDAELVSHLPATDKPVYLVPLRLVIDKFQPVYPENKEQKPLLVHAPSKRKTKGTERILEELKKIDLDYELVLVEGKKQEEALEIYKKADIIIDQISVGTYGVFAIEAMLLGKPVITYISDDMKKFFPKTLPIVSAEFDNIVLKLKTLIENSDKRREIGIKSRQYAERYHDTCKVSKHLTKIYTGEIENKNIFELL